MANESPLNVKEDTFVNSAKLKLIINPSLGPS